MFYTASMLPNNLSRIEVGESVQFDFQYYLNGIDNNVIENKLRRNRSNTKERQIASGLLVFEDKLLLVRRALNDCHAPGALEIPGGGEELEDQHDFLKTLERELREEVGLESLKGREISILNSFKIDYRGEISIQINYLVKLNNMPLLKLSSEVDELIWVTRDTFIDTVRNDPLHSPGEMAGIITYLYENILIEDA